MKITVVILLCLSAVAVLSCSTPSSEVETWRGLVVAPEQSCNSAEEQYNFVNLWRSSLSNPNLKDDVIATNGLYNPYTGEYLSHTSSFPDHILDIYEALRSGLCDASTGTLGTFGRDISNLTLVGLGAVDQNLGKDAAEWLPEFNQCWFVSKVIKTRQRYGLTIDRAEADAIDNVIMGCDHFELVYER